MIHGSSNDDTSTRFLDSETTYLPVLKKPPPRAKADCLYSATGD